MRDNVGARRPFSSMGRRDFLRTLGAAGAGAAGIAAFDPFKFARAAITPGEKGLYITALYRTKTTLNNYGFIVRIETNKGITGYGECRDLDSGNQAGLAKYGPIVLGMNPTQVDKVFSAMKAAYTPPSNMADQELSGVGAISGIEMACWDIIGKVYNVPVWKLLGTKVRDKIPLYADTDNSSAAQINARIAKGFLRYKCDMYMSSIAAGNYTTSSTNNNYGYKEITLNSTGLNQMASYLQGFRNALVAAGEPFASAPIGSDHYQGYNGTNQLSVASAVALANILKPISMGGYVEDIIDWWTNGCSGAPSKAVADATTMNLQTGEDMFGFEQYKSFIDIGACDIIHPEPNTAGGLSQTLLAAKYAHSKGVKTAFHNSSGPVAMTAYAHLAAVLPSFEAMEFHHMDVSWHDDLVDGIDKPMITSGQMNVPEGPGLGITLNATALSAHGATSWTKVA
jgi:L-alanine-DL-glutamate epimerase-like enolase superfamily enzyme